MQGLKVSGFNLNIEGSLKDYQSCCVIKDSGLKSILILQPHLIKNLEAEFGHELCNKRVYKTPGTADDDVNDSALQGQYQSVVGMLLYLTKYSLPDL
jgi:hypothetical protein